MTTRVAEMARKDTRAGQTYRDMKLKTFHKVKFENILTSFMFNFSSDPKHKKASKLGHKTKKFTQFVK